MLFGATYKKDIIETVLAPSWELGIWQSGLARNLVGGPFTPEAAALTIYELTTVSLQESWILLCIL